MRALRRVSVVVLLAAVAVWVPATWTALADQDRMRLFYGWVAEGILATAHQDGVEAAASARMRWARYGTSLAIRTPSAVYVRPGDGAAPRALDLRLEGGRARPTFERGLVVHRGRDAAGQPLAVVLRDAPLRVQVPGWVLGVVGLGLAVWLLLSLRGRARWGAVLLGLALVAPTGAAWHDLELRRSQRHIRGAWGLLAELNAQGGHALGPINAGDSGWTHSAELARPAPAAGVFTGVGRRGEVALVLSWRRAMFGFGVWAVLMAVGAAALGRAATGLHGTRPSPTLGDPPARR